MPNDRLYIRRKGADPEEILWDFWDETGDNNPQGIKTKLVAGVHFGEHSPDTDTARREPNGVQDVFYELRELLAVFPMRASAPDGKRSTLVRGLGELSRLLVAGGGDEKAELVWQPPEEDEPKIIDYLKSAPITLYRGQAGTDADQPRIATEGIDREIPVEIRTQPTSRGPELDSTTNLIPSNPSLLDDADGDGRPTGWEYASALDISNEAIDEETGAPAYSFDIATDAERVLEGSVYDAAASITGKVFTFSFFAWSDDADAKVKARITWQDSAGADLSSDDGTLTILGTSPPDFSDPTDAIQVTATAPASAERVEPKIVVDNDDATSRRIHVVMAQVEEAAGPLLWVPGELSVSNNPSVEGGRAIPVYGHGESEAPMVLTQEFTDADAAVQAAVIGRRSGFPRGIWIPFEGAGGAGWTITHGDDTTDTTDPDSWTGTAARTTHSTDPTVSKKRTRAETTDADILEALRGEHDVYVRAEAGGDRDFLMRLAYSPSLANLAIFRKPEVSHDPNGASTFGFVEKRLGRIQIPEDGDLGGVALEFWSRQESGTAQNLDVDGFWLVPVEQASRLEVPGSGEQSWLGSELETPVTDPSGGTAGTVVGTTMEFDADGQNAGTPPNSGLIYPAGRVTATWVVRRISGTSATQVIQLRVRRIAGPGTTIISHSEDFAGAAIGETRTIRLSFDADGIAAYQIQAEGTDLGARRLAVAKLSAVTDVSAEQDQSFQTHSERQGVGLRDSADMLLSPLLPAGPLPTLRPGWQVLTPAYEDIPPGGTYDEGESVKDRLASVRLAYSPRYLVG